jgi:hypothetical protein
MNFFRPLQSETPAALSLAASLVMHADRTLGDRVAEHKERFREFWASSVTPAQICAELGDQGQRYLACAAESVEHIGRLAAIHGKTLDEVLPPEHRTPRLAFAPLPDGHITVTPDPTKDAWGRPLPQIAPEAEE